MSRVTRNPKNSTSANTVARSVRISVTLDEQIAARQPASMTTGEWLRRLLVDGLNAQASQDSVKPYNGGLKC